MASPSNYLSDYSGGPLSGPNAGFGPPPPVPLPPVYVGPGSDGSTTTMGTVSLLTVVIGFAVLFTLSHA